MAAWTFSVRLAFIFVHVSSCADSSNADIVCPPNWVQNGQFCYFVVNVATTWTEANKHCLDIGGLLVVIESAEENAFIIAMLRSQTLVETRVWLGCNDKAVEGKWVCLAEGNITKPVEFTEWESKRGQPNNFHNQDCASVIFADNDEYGWYDDKCDGELFPSVCERRAAPRGSAEGRGVTIGNADLTCTKLDSTGHPIV